MKQTTQSHQELLDKFPPLEEFKANIERFKQKNLKNLSQEQIFEEFIKHLIVIPVVYGVYSKEQLNDTIFYRVRVIEKGSEDMTMIRTFSYPPRNFCKENGRANLAGKSIFYASDFAYPAMAECKKADNDYGYLSLWKPTFDRDINVSTILPKKLNTLNIYQESADKMHSFLDKQSRTMGREKKEQMDELIKFVSEYYMEEKAPYYLTSWLSNQLLYERQLEPQDMLIYPSVNTEANFCNFAINPNIADLYLKFQKVFMFKYSDCSMGYVGKMHGGFVMWSKPTKEESDEFYDAIEKGIKKK